MNRSSIIILLACIACPIVGMQEQLPSISMDSLDKELQISREKQQASSSSQVVINMDQSVQIDDIYQQTLHHLGIQVQLGTKAQQIFGEKLKNITADERERLVLGLRNQQDNSPMPKRTITTMGSATENSATQLVGNGTQPASDGAQTESANTDQAIKTLAHMLVEAMQQENKGQEKEIGNQRRQKFIAIGTAVLGFASNVAIGVAINYLSQCQQQK